MAIRKFIIEVEEGMTHCLLCPFECGQMLTINCPQTALSDVLKIDCNKYNLATMKIKKLEEIK